MNILISFPPRYSVARVVGVLKSISGSKISKEFPNLKHLVLGYNAFIYLDLDPLKECPKIEEIYFDRCMLEEIDLTPLEACKKLREITFRGNGLSKIDI